MSVRGTENARDRGGAALRYQVLTIRSGKVVEIVGFDDRTEALSYAGSAGPSRAPLAERILPVFFKGLL